MAASKADEAAGLAPGNEDHEAGCYFSPEKPYCPLFTEGRIGLVYYKKGQKESNWRCLGRSCCKGGRIPLPDRRETCYNDSANDRRGR